MPAPANAALHASADVHRMNKVLDLIDAHLDAELDLARYEPETGRFECDLCLPVRAA